MAKRLCGAVVLGPCSDTVLLLREGDSWTLPFAACDEDRTAAQHLAAVDCVRQATGGLDVSAYTNNPPWVLEVRLAALTPCYGSIVVLQESKEFHHFSFAAAAPEDTPACRIWHETWHQTWTYLDQDTLRLFLAYK